MKKYIVVKDLKGYGKVGDILCSENGIVTLEIQRNNCEEYYTGYRLVSSDVNAELLIALGAIIEQDWKPKQNDIFYTPMVTGAEGKRFIKHVFSEGSETHKRWRDDGLCFITQELADSTSKKMIDSIK